MTPQAPIAHVNCRENNECMSAVYERTRIRQRPRQSTRVDPAGIGIGDMEIDIPSAYAFFGRCPASPALRRSRRHRRLSSLGMKFCKNVQGAYYTEDGR